jgi:hypothetical protein
LIEARTMTATQASGAGSGTADLEAFVQERLDRTYLIQTPSRLARVLARLILQQLA